MTFDEVLDQVRELLQRRGRVTCRAVKRRFDLDDAYLEDLKGENTERNRESGKRRIGEGAKSLF